MDTYNWYSQLIRPEWAPPSWIFGPVWSVLYIIIAISFGAVFYQAYLGKLPWIVTLPLILNLIFNFAFTPIQFGLRNNLLAAADIIFVWITIIWAMVALFPLMRWVAYCQIPYLLWVSFAMAVQFTITYLNR
jgi:tryptophan-rich sensory protein